MKINLHIPKNQQFQPLYMFFIIVSMMTGVQMIGTPRMIFLEAKQDAWISLILAYLFLLLLVFTILYILRQYENADLLGIQADIFGSFFSKVIGTVFIVMYGVQLLITLLIYIEVIKVFIFPDSNAFILGLMLVTLVVYASLGGLRVIIGVCFLFMLLSSWIIPLLIDPIKQMDWLNFLPIMDNGIINILQGTLATGFTFSGFEVLFFIYPFVDKKERIAKPIFLGISWTVLLVLITTVISIGYLNPTQLERRIWTVLSLFKTQTSPTIERLDYVVVAEWMMITTPRAILLLWCITYILKRIYNMPKKMSIYLTMSIVLFLIPFFNEFFEIQMLIENSKYLTYILIYIYPFILLPLVIIKKKVTKKARQKE